jgi:hypothetical protein
VLEFIVIFTLAAGGSLICLTADLAQKILARRSQGGLIATSGARGPAADETEMGDPILTVGFILTCYGAVALFLVFELPGPLALERTCLTFALLCVGGLIGEICKTSPKTQPTVENHDDPVEPAKPVSLRVSLALTLVLNLTFAVLSTNQGLIEIVPKAHNAPHAEELDPIVVIGQRSYDAQDARKGTGRLDL